MKGLLAGAFALLGMLVAPTMASAVIIPVTTEADEYSEGPSCSLRESITAAQSNVAFGGCPAGFVTDTITLPSGHYRITRAGSGEDGNATGDFDIGNVDELEIRAAGPDERVTIDGNGLDRVFDKFSVNKLKLTSVRVTGGVLTDIEDGGGIRTGTGISELESVTVDGNSSAYSAGGIAVYAQLLMINSTISGNKSGGSGGGFYVPGGAMASARSSTIYGNQADSDGDGNGNGGGFALFGGTSVNFTNVINAGNTATSTVPGNADSDCYSGPTYFPRYTLQTQPLGPSTCLVGFNQSSFSVTDAKVDPVLRYNGGQTPTHNLLPGSPAIDAGGGTIPDECPGLDQNGVGRPASSCDIGAVQFVPKPQLTFTRIQPKKKVIKRKKSKLIKMVVKNSGTGPVFDAVVCLKLPKASRKGLKIKGKACKNRGNFAVGQAKQVKVRLTARAKAKRKAYKVKATAKATNLGVTARTFKVRVR